METFTENARPLAFLLSEANGFLSRDTVIIASGAGKLEAGTVLGQVTTSKKHVVSPNAEVVGSEGAETAVAVLAYPVDATDADVEAVVVNKDAEAKIPMLIFHASVNDNTKRNAKLTQLRSVGIKAR